MFNVTECTNRCKLYDLSEPNLHFGLMSKVTHEGAWEGYERIAKFTRFSWEIMPIYLFLYTGGPQVKVVIPRETV